MTSIGETLRRERLRRNLDLERVSNELKIAPRMLEAIESERFEKLPGRVFAKNFVRQYARLLELDDDELAAELQRTFDPPAPGTLPAGGAPAAGIPLPRMKGWQAVGDGGFRWSSSLPALALVVAVMLVCSGLYAWWQRVRRPVAPHQTAAAAQTAPPVRMPVPIPQPAAAPPAVQPAPPPSNAAPAPPPAVSPGSPSAPAKEALVVPSQAGTIAPPTPAPSGPVHVQVTAQEPVWVLAQIDGKYAFSGTLEMNETRAIDARTTVLLRIGNAGGVTISLNGKALNPVGPKGQVRTVQLTSGGFQIVPPAPPKPVSPGVTLDPL